jgi:DNA-binding NarL/FixJ family response regulator
MEKIRILLADDHLVIRDGLKVLINAQPDMLVVGEADNGFSAFQQTIELKPDIVVMDVTMPELNGEQATRQIKEKIPQVKVLVLTMHEDKVYFQELLRAGASGYVPKRAASEELIGAIRVVYQGGVFVDPYILSSAVSSLSNPEGEDSLTGRPELLSLREREVVCLVSQGFTTKEIADQLDISMKTVETYKYRAMEKLGVRTRSELFRYVLRQGWLKEEP